MKKNRSIPIQRDDQGHLVLPDEILREAGLVPGGDIRVAVTPQGLSLSDGAASLKRVYVEPTNACNLDCRTCMRNAWDEPLGRMAWATYERVLEGITAFNPPPLLFFGGFGEPLAHPRFLEMVAAARQAGIEVELITNGILLEEAVARRLIELGVSRVWVSIDGATPASYTDVRLGDALPLVIANLSRLQALRAASGAPAPKLGIAFVAMKRNIADLPEVIHLGVRLGADRFSVSNVLPHTEELRAEVLYARSMYESALQPSRWSPQVWLPRLDLDRAALEGLAVVLEEGNAVQIARRPLDGGTNTCPFIEKHSTSIRWDGVVSPCLPLLHTHTSFLAETRRTSFAYAIGSLSERTLFDLWHDPGYARLRERLQEFDFSPCTFCNSCDLSESNMEDCFGSGTPACGGCLWAQGFIQCP